MIREQSRFTINPLYIVAVAMCCICSICTTFYQALFFGLVTIVIALFCINIVSFVERIADKNLRAFIIAILAAVIVVLGEYVIEIMANEFLLANASGIKWVLLAVVSLCIVPTYFETRLTNRYYFVNMFYSLFAFLVMILVYSIVIEFLGYGTFAGMVVIQGFAGFEFALQLFFQLFVIGVMVIIANIIYQKSEDRKMQFDLLVEKYKIQIKRVLTNKYKNKENSHE